MMEMRMDLKLIQVPTFEYEVRGKYLNLYNRVKSEEGEEFLTFRAQVPFKRNLEDAVKHAVEKAYANTNLDMNPTIENNVIVSDLRCKRKTIEYTRY